jgi:hypothetical protein
MSKKLTVLMFATNLMLLGFCIVLATNLINSQNQILVSRINALENMVKTNQKTLEDYQKARMQPNIESDRFMEQVKKIRGLVRHKSGLKTGLVNEITDHIVVDYIDLKNPPAFSLCLATWIKETDIRPDKIGHDGERGISQILPTTWKDCGRPGDFHNWRDTLKLGYRLLEERWAYSKGNKHLTAMYYNGGLGIYRCNRKSIKRAELYANGVLNIENQMIKQFGESI